MLPEDRGPRRRRWLAIGISLAIHSLLFLVVIEGRLPKVDRGSTLLMIPLPEPEPPPATVTPYYVPLEERGQGRARVPLRPVRPEEVPPPVRVVEPVLPEPVDTGGVPRSPAPRIGPGLATGRLWVRPLPLPPRELAQRLSKSHEQLVDSAVTAIVQRFLDSIAVEPGADRVKLPDWTTTVAGAKFGLDSRNIYIAGLKIPAAVLALLPLPTGGNQQQALDHNGAWIAEDLRRAASRAATLDEFKQAVRELRERKEYERQLERAQREQPDSAKKKE
ncbi:MAG TPA: hypothetical protein VG692_02785 [Gemmatimonadales bacterium]|nr:hypothetical protein [Gemmatimonadales bacterium]